jgi:branched-subunit amino acid transport protein
MSDANTWYIVAACAGLTVATLVSRGSFFMLPSRWKLPPRVERALRYAPACALAAIIAPEVLTRQGEFFIALENDRLWAAVTATIVFIATRNMLAMMAAGMAVFTVLRLFV